MLPYGNKIIKKSFNSFRNLIFSFRITRRVYSSSFDGTSDKLTFWISKIGPCSPKYFFQIFIHRFHNKVHHFFSLNKKSSLKKNEVNEKEIWLMLRLKVVCSMTVVLFKNRFIQKYPYTFKYHASYTQSPFI